jgi:hypothetical protein
MKVTSIVGALCAIQIMSATVSAAPVSGQGTWETTLQARDLDGNAVTVEGYYDTVLDITWLAEANYAQTSGRTTNGYLNLQDSQTWVAGLNINGITGWRLPMMLDTGPGGCNDATSIEVYSGTDCGYNVQTGSAATTVFSEMASMYYDTLGNLAYYDTSGIGPQPGYGLTNSGPFDGILRSYWFSSGGKFQFDIPTAIDQYGLQVTAERVNAFEADGAAWVVHDGDVGSPVPIPAAAWLFGSGLIGLLAFSRRRNVA